MKKCVIVGGADIEKYDIIKSYFCKDDFFVYCDSGLKHREKLGASPDLIVGDFDSFENPHSETETIVLPCVKDDTDTVFAVKEMMKRGYDEFLLIGVIGARLDHTLGNVYILTMLEKAGKRGIIVDDYSEMEMITDKTAYIEDKYSFFSLLNINGKAEGVTIENAKYNLSGAVISDEYQYGVSNEVEKGKTAAVSVKNGALLLIKIR